MHTVVHPISKYYTAKHWGYSHNYPLDVHGNLINPTHWFVMHKVAIGGSGE